MPLIGATLAAAGWLGSADLLSDAWAVFFCTGFSGRLYGSSCSAPISREHWRDRRDARSHERRSHAVGKHARKLAALALCVVVPDFVALALAASYTISIEAVWVCLFFYLLTGVFAACFFFKLVYDANVDVIALMRHRRGHIAEPVAHMIGWLGISGIFLCLQMTGFLLCVLTTPAIRAVAHSPAIHLPTVIVLFLGRIGASYAQVRSLDPIGATTARSAAQVAPDKTAVLADAPRSAALAGSAGECHKDVLAAAADGSTPRLTSEASLSPEDELYSRVLQPQSGTVELDLGGSARARIPLRDGMTVRELRHAIEAWYMRPGLVARALLVDHAYELDDEDVAAAVIKPSEKVTVAWARTTVPAQPHETVHAPLGPPPLTYWTSSTKSSSGQLTGRSDSGGTLPSVCEDDGDSVVQSGTP